MQAERTDFDLDHYLQLKQARVELLLGKRIESFADRVPSKLLDSMRYSLLAGGKRLRPILCIAFAEASAQQSNAGGAMTEDAACALEFIHTYSLVHDDLPAMDDDDLRRGKPTNHKVYGEALAILAGDALLTEAFHLLSTGKNDREENARRIALVRELATAAGAAGMVGGQTLDIDEERPAEEGYLLRLHRLKTGALIRAACRMGVICGGGTQEQLEAAGAYGDSVGLAFQIADDVLDVEGDPQKLGKPARADAAAGRHTFPAVIGLPRARKMMEDRVQMAIAAVSRLEPSPGPLRALAKFVVERKA